MAVALDSTTDFMSSQFSRVRLSEDDFTRCLPTTAQRLLPEAHLRPHTPSPSGTLDNNDNYTNMFTHGARQFPGSSTTQANAHGSFSSAGVTRVSRSRSALEGGTLSAAAEAELRQAKEDVEMKILTERLQLLRTQREIAALRCERFTLMLDTYLKEQSERQAEEQSQRDVRGCRKGAGGYRRGAGGNETDAYETDAEMDEPQVPKSLSTPPLPPSGGYHHRRQRSLGLGEVALCSSPVKRQSSKGRHRRQSSCSISDEIKGPFPPRHTYWRSPEFSGIWRNDSVPNHTMVCREDGPGKQNSLP